MTPEARTVLNRLLRQSRQFACLDLKSRTQEAVTRSAGAHYLLCQLCLIEGPIL